MCPHLYCRAVTSKPTLGPRGILSGLRFVVENKKELCIAVDAKERERAAMMTRGRNASTRTRRAALCLLLAMGVCLLDVARATFPYLGGYEPFTDVTEHSKIDLDLINIKGNLGETCGASCVLGATCPATSSAADGTGCGYDGSVMEFPRGTTCQWGGDKDLDSGTCDATSNAYDIWREGQNSEISSAMRKIAAFASGAATKGASASVPYRDNKYIAIMNKYWKKKVSTSTRGATTWSRLLLMGQA